MPNKSQLYFIRGGASSVVGRGEISLSDAIFPDQDSAVVADINNRLAVIFPSAEESVALFPGVAASSYTGGDATLSLFWAANVNVGSVNWLVSFERNNALGPNINADSFAAEVSSPSSAPPVVGILRRAVFVLNNADLDGLMSGDPYRFKIRRDGGTPPDTMAGDAQLIALSLNGV